MTLERFSIASAGLGIGAIVFGCMGCMSPGADDDLAEIDGLAGEESELVESQASAIAVGETEEADLAAPSEEGNVATTSDGLIIGRYGAWGGAPFARGLGWVTPGAGMVGMVDGAFLGGPAYGGFYGGASYGWGSSTVCDAWGCVSSEW